MPNVNHKYANQKLEFIHTYFYGIYATINLDKSYINLPIDPIYEAGKHLC